MIYEYAVDPEVASQWGLLENYRFFVRELGLGQGRLMSRYPKKWARRVWESYAGYNDMEKKRLEDLLAQIQATIIKRQNYIWEDGNTWLENARLEHARHNFRAILVKNNNRNRPELLDINAFSTFPCPGWDHDHGTVVRRDAEEVAEMLGMLLTRCRWVKFIDPYFSVCRPWHKKSMTHFFRILAGERPVGTPELIEMHTSGDNASSEHLKSFYERIIPEGLQVFLYQWRKKQKGQSVHNRFILSDIGGISFQHGLDSGEDGDTDDIGRLDSAQYEFRCQQYNPEDPSFDYAAEPILLIGKKRNR